MKKIIVFLLMAGILFFGDCTVSAQEYQSVEDYTAQIKDGTQVYDFAELIDDEGQNQLEKSLDEAIEASKLDIVIVTVSDNFGTSQAQLCDFIYESGGFGYEENIKNASGVVFLIDMEDRQMYISTYGIAILYLNDTVYNLILDDIEEEMHLADYHTACEEVVEDIVYFSNQAQTTKAYQNVLEKWYSGAYSDYQYLENDNQREFASFENLVFDFDEEGLIAWDEDMDVYSYSYKGYHEVTMFSMFANPLINFVIGVVVAAIAVFVMACTSKTKMTADRYTYAAQEGIRMNIKQDTFIRRTTTKRKIESSSGGGTRGNGGGGSHRSTSSGRSAGGGGRGF